MEKTYSVELQGKVESFISDKNISQAKAAQMMDVNAGFLSLFRSGKKYGGNIEDQEQKSSQRRILQAQPTYRQLQVAAL